MECSFSAWRSFRERACAASWHSRSVILWFCSRSLVLEASSYTEEDIRIYVAVTGRK